MSSFGGIGITIYIRRYHLIIKYFGYVKIYIIDFETALSVASLHIPVEMAITSFTIEKGENSSFHKFVDPRSLPEW